MKRLTPVLAALAVLNAVAPAAEAVYDNLAFSNPDRWEFAGGNFPDTLADEVFLGATNRRVTKLEFVTAGPFPTEPVSVAMYRNDGPGGAPGTQIWSSGPSILFFQLGLNTVVVPSILVPGHITVAIRNERLTQLFDGQQWLADGPPTIGSSPNHVWRRNGPSGAWSMDSTTAGSNDLCMRVTAVPEPATFAAIGLGLASFRARKKRSTSCAKPPAVL